MQPGQSRTSRNDDLSPPATRLANSWTGEARGADLETDDGPDASLIVAAAAAPCFHVQSKGKGDDMIALASALLLEASTLAHSAEVSIQSVV